MNSHHTHAGIPGGVGASLSSVLRAGNVSNQSDLAAKKVSLVDQELECIAKNLSVLDENIGVLFSRLDGILQPEPCSTPSAVAENPMAHGLVGRLQILSSKLCSQYMAIRNITDRLTL